MIKWIQYLLSSAPTLTLPQIGPSFDRQALPARQSSRYISDTTIQWLDGFREKYDVPGFGIGIISSPARTEHGWQSEILSFGHSDNHCKAYKEETTFHIGANSKLFVSMSIGLLVNNNTLLPSGDTLHYDTKIKDILPDWDLIDEYARDHLDLLDVLSMRSGIPQHIQSMGSCNSSEMVHQLRYLRPSTEIRQTMQMNDRHYWVLAEIVKRLSNVSIVDFAFEHLFGPLNMTTTTVNHTAAAMTSNLAGSYVRQGINPTKCQASWDDAGRMNRSCFGYPVATEWFVEGPGLFIPGPIISSCTDMLRWVRELLDPQVLPPRVVAETHKCIIPAFGDSPKFDERGMPCYGHAQVTYKYRGHELIQHRGILPGAGSSIVRAPALGIGIVLAINEVEIGEAVIDPIIYRVLDDMLGLDPIDWEDRLVTGPMKSKPPLTVKPPSDLRSAPRSEDIIGSYFDPGYGHLNISAFGNIPNFEISSHDLLDAFQQLKSDAPTPTHVALMSNVFSRGLILTHFDGPVYNATRIEVATKLEDGKAIPILHGSYTAVLVEGAGLGMFDNFWEEDKGRAAVEDDVEGQAEVWFAKID